MNAREMLEDAEDYISTTGEPMVRLRQPAALAVVEENERLRAALTTIAHRCPDMWVSELARGALGG